MLKGEPRPQRLRRSRQQGARLISPNGLPVVCVTRPGKWGNPYKGHPTYDPEGKLAVGSFRENLLAGSLGITVEDVRRELRGKNLACYCAIDAVCHADVLLELANASDNRGGENEGHA